jgi:L-ribulose-5-phosphate 3-epimerase
MASILGARIALVVPGVAVSEIDYREHFDRVVGVLKKASRIAYRYNVVIGLEPVWNRLFPSPLEYEKILEDVGEANVEIYFDVGNTLPHSLPEHWIRILRNRIAQVHVKDFSLENLSFGIPGTGSVNWEAVKKALGGIGYNGYLVAEIPWNEEEPYKSLSMTLERLREIFGG